MTAALVAALAATALATPALRPAPGIDVPPAFRAELYATGLHHPTAMAYGPDGLLYVTQDTGEVVAVGRGSARPRVVARGFRVPLGIVWRGRTAYVSAQGALWRTTLRGRVLAGRRAVVSGLPYGLHQQDNVVVGPGGRLYFGSGTTCDVCVEADRRSGAILSVRPDGSDLRVEARGLRNPYGLHYAPETRRLYVTVNNRDDLGTWEPAETVVVLRRGAHYGWPACWPSWRERRLRGSCGGIRAPLAYLEPHSAPVGLVQWGDWLYVAEWGQYYSRQFGRKVVRVHERSGRVRAFADGFEHPIAVIRDPRGGLLVADWGRGAIYRIGRRR